MAGFNLSPREGAGKLTAISVATGNIASGGTATLIAAPGAGLYIRVHRLLVANTVLSTLVFQDGAGNVFNGAFNLNSGATLFFPFDGNAWFECAVNASFQVVNGTGVNNNVNGFLFYTVTNFLN
jgi:hypothetical protein